MNEHAPLSTTGNDRILPGGNNPPPELTPFEAIAAEADDLVLEATNFADGKTITSAEVAEAVTGLHQVASDIIGRAEAMRAAEVKPLNDAKDVIQARFHPLIGDTKAGKGRLILAKAALGQLLTGWRVAELARKAAADFEAAREAEEAKRKAEEAMRASSGNLAARSDAELLVGDARIAAEDAKRIHRAATTGLGLRTSYRPVMVDGGKAAEHYWNNRRADFQTMLQNFAADDVRRGIRSIPGFDVLEEKTAV